MFEVIGIVAVVVVGVVAIPVLYLANERRRGRNPFN